MVSGVWMWLTVGGEDMDGDVARRRETRYGMVDIPHMSL